MTNIVNDEIIAKILTSDDSNNRIKILQWDVTNDIVKAGSNFASQVSRLTINYEKNGAKRKKVLFLKVPFNSVAYKDFDEVGVYDKEILMYTEVLPQLYAIDDEYFTPKNYFVDGKKSLFQKDLSLSGYKMSNNLEQLNVEQCYYALKCLAKLHGLSVKLESTVGLSDTVKRNIRCEENDLISFYKAIDEFVDNLPTDVKEKYPKQIATYKSTTWEQYARVMLPRTDSFNVLNHGDFWTNNIMFKYDKFGILKKVKLIDFQLCCWTNPVSDLIYFFITSVKFEVYEKYFDFLLNVYLSTLNKVLGKLTGGSYQMEDLVKDIETRYLYSCIVITHALPFSMSDPEDPLDLESEDGKLNSDPLLKIYKQKYYRNVAMKWFLHLIEKGVFDGTE